MAKTGGRPGFASAGSTRTFFHERRPPMRFRLRLEGKTASVLLAALIFGAEDMPAAAQVVYCTNCSSELTQLQNYLQLVSTLAKQVALLEQAITQTGIL